MRNQFKNNTIFSDALLSLYILYYVIADRILILNNRNASWNV